MDFSLKVGQSLKNGIHSLIQAPTGTGKTMGYLVPSLLFAKTQQTQVLLATGTKTLQSQAMDKDVPTSLKILGENRDSIKISRLVGSNNHLCELNFRKGTSEEDLFSAEQSFQEKYSKLYFDLAFQYNEMGAVDKTTCESLPFILKKIFPKFKEYSQELAVDYRSCVGNKCPFARSCTYLKGLRDAKEADLIIGNHSLMLTWPRGLERPQHIIVDEAHRLEKDATEAFKRVISQRQLQYLHKSLETPQTLGSFFYLISRTFEDGEKATGIIQELKKENEKWCGIISEHLEALDDLVEPFFKKRPRYTSMYWNEIPFMDETQLKDSMSTAILNHFKSLTVVLNEVYSKLSVYFDDWSKRNFTEENDQVAFVKIGSLVGNIEDLKDTFNLLFYSEEEEQNTRSFKFKESDGFQLDVVPIDIGKALHEELWSKSEATIMTSATLGSTEASMAKEGVEWPLGYLYVEPERRFKEAVFLPPVYDYQNKTKVFLCDDTPRLNDAAFVPEVIKQVSPLVRKLEGRSLFLFSSRVRFEKARELLLKEFDGEIPLFVQGMGQNIVEEYRRAERGILLGMESFGEGIDIPGSSLEFLFIDKIPDLSMEQVIQKRRDFFDKNFGPEFYHYYLYQRSRSLQQKLGRLIRTDSDRGAALIVDSRVRNWKGKTMESLTKLMEPYQLKRLPLKDGLESIEKFLL